MRLGRFAVLNAVTIGMVYVGVALVATTGAQYYKDLIANRLSVIERSKTQPSIKIRKTWLSDKMFLDYSGRVQVVDDFGLLYEEHYLQGGKLIALDKYDESGNLSYREFYENEIARARHHYERGKVVFEEWFDEKGGAVGGVPPVASRRGPGPY